MSEFFTQPVGAAPIDETEYSGQIIKCKKCKKLKPGRRPSDHICKPCRKVINGAKFSERN